MPNYRYKPEIREELIKASGIDSVPSVESDLAFRVLKALDAMPEAEGDAMYDALSESARKWYDDAVEAFEKRGKRSDISHLPPAKAGKGDPEEEEEEDPEEETEEEGEEEEIDPETGEVLEATGEEGENEEGEDMAKTATKAKSNGKKPAAKAAPDKKAGGEKKAPFGGRKGRKPLYAPTAVITLKKTDNPHRPTASDFSKWKKLKTGMTVEKAIAAGVDSSYLRYAVGRDLINIT